MLHSGDDWGRQRRIAQTAPMLTQESERELLLRAQRGDRRAVDALVASHMRLVVSVASRHAKGSLSPHDLVAEGAVGLLEAIRRYDYARDTRFASYAVFWVRAWVSRYALANRRIVGAPSTRAARKARAQLRRTERALVCELGRAPSRAELAQALQIDEQDVQAVDAAGDVSLGQEGAAEPADPQPLPETMFADEELRALRRRSVAQALEQLSEREHSIVHQHMAEEPRSLAELARELGVSRQRTGQIMANARVKLRGPLEQVA